MFTIRRLTTEAVEQVNMRTAWQDDDDDDDDMMAASFDVYTQSERMAIKRRLGSDGSSNTGDSDGGTSSDASSPNKQQRAGASTPAGGPCRRRRQGSASRERYLRRLESNERERIRMHGLNAAFHNLQEVIPSVRMERKMSKIETLTLARNYIMALTNVICEIKGGDKPFSFLDQFAPTSEQQVEEVMRNFRLGGASSSQTGRRRDQQL
ncbi:Protein dimmed [Amphibalanus amphitrite]|uniref:Protein dimmed n=1 Tax=Amphibalanus amphitrite TaxID=1232801 RepID=A0A6A4WXD6_AMPAM|nr:Protein dimmed [Amphibalanus amphitrite]